jgi:hypothetical protein
LALATSLGDFCGSFYSQTNETVLSCPQPRFIGEISRQQRKFSTRFTGFDLLAEISQLFRCGTVDQSESLALAPLRRT